MPYRAIGPFYAYGKVHRRIVGEKGNQRKQKNHAYTITLMHSIKYYSTDIIEHLFECIGHKDVCLHNRQVYFIIRSV